MILDKKYESGRVAHRSLIGELLQKELSLDGELFSVLSNINFYFFTEGWCIDNTRYYYIRINKQFRNHKDREGIDIIVKQDRSDNFDVNIESVTFYCLFKLYLIRCNIL